MSLNCELFHLQARGSFHFGVRGVGLEETADYPPSDTLFSALCHMVRLTDGEQALTTMLAGFRDGAPPFLIGGAYPFVKIGDDDVLRFYPAPLSLGLEYPDLKDIRWLSESLFMAYCDANQRPALLAGIDAASLLHLSAAAAHDEVQGLRARYGVEMRLWHRGEVARVTVDRVSSASTIYHAGRLTFAEGGGLWFAYCPLEEAWTADVIGSLLVELGDHGLGGERSAGHGQFDLIGTIATQYPQPGAGERFVALSHVYPKPSEMGLFGAGSAYALLTRRGWVSSPDLSSLRRKTTRMAAAGSVLLAAGDAPLGGLASVTPDGFTRHPVYRYGWALPYRMG